MANPQIGTVEDGYEYVGPGPASDPMSWRRVRTQQEQDWMNGYQQRQGSAGAAVRGLAGALSGPAELAMFGIDLPSRLMGTTPPSEFFNIKPNQSLLSVAESTGLPTQYDESRAGNRILDYGLQGFGLGGPAAALTRKAGTGILAALTGQAGSDLAAGTGAAAAEKIFPDSPLAPAIGSLVGTGLGLGVAAGTRGIARGADGTAMQNNINLVESVGIPPTVGLTTTNKYLPYIENALSSTPGGMTIAKQRSRVANQGVQDAVEMISGQRNFDIESVGRMIKSGMVGAGGWTQRTKATRDRLYSDFDSYVGATSPSPATNTYSYFSSGNKGVAGAPNLSERLFVDKGLKDDATAFFADLQQGNGQIPYEALKRLRTSVFDRLGDPTLINSESRAELIRLQKALTSDMEDMAKRAGPDAERAFQRANRYNRLRNQRIEEFVDDISKKIGGEDVYRYVIGKSPSDSTQLFVLKNSLKPAQWDAVRSIILSRMGRVAPGQETQDFSFSMQKFLTNWNQISQANPRALDALFGTTKSPYRKDLETIVSAIGKVSENSKILFNPSGTVGSGLFTATLGITGTGAGTALVGALAGNAGTMLAGLGTLGSVAAMALSTNTMTKIMMNPRTAKWLAETTKIPPGRLVSHANRLGAMAANDPEMEEELLSLRDAIKEMVAGQNR